ncbi:MAG TPA: tripartite tricarboxylate transporter substrate binding protein [Burkholderiales bacterium]|jgi:tripartite-type tricarboxylate transporter receptor subunit TctC
MKRLTTAAACLLLAGAAHAQAQSWPTKPIHLVEPAGPGSAVDVFARQYGPLLADILGQPVIIDNRPGANSAIGACEVARSPADGYTLLHGNINNSLNDLITKDTHCRLNEALIPVARLTVTPLVMVINPGVKAKDLKAYLALAKAQPQLLTFASGGRGAITQLLGEKIKTTAGITVREIPYKAIGAELPDLLAGHVDTAYLSPVVVRQHITAGKLRAMGVASNRRLKIIPDVPTLAEAGLPGVEASGWNGIFVPAGTPRAIIDRLAAETAKILASPAIKNDSIAQGYEVDAAGPEAYAAYIRAEIAKWGGVIRDSHLDLEQ